MRFPYRQIPSSSRSRFAPGNGPRRPILRLQLSHRGQHVSPIALLDTGADTCVFPASVATQLGVALPTADARSFSGTSSTLQLAFYHPVLVTLWNGDLSQTPLRFKLVAGFSDSLEHLGLGLLGQEGFFSQFPVCFHRAEGFFEIG